MYLKLSYRFNDDPPERPDRTEEVRPGDEASTRAAIEAAGGKITGRREVHWQESLARMENNPE